VSEAHGRKEPYLRIRPGKCFEQGSREEKCLTEKWNRKGGIKEKGGDKEKGILSREELRSNLKVPVD